MYKEIKKELTKNLIRFEEDFSLNQFTTFRIGGPCPLFIKCDTPKKLTKLIHIFNKYKTPFISIGLGSNLLISDEGVPSPVVSFYSKKPIIKRMKNTIIASASTKLDDVVIFAAENGLKGLNFATGIPGTLGGAIVGNAGAFGAQIGDIVRQVDVVNHEGKISFLNKLDLNFSYRNSMLKKKYTLIVSSVSLELEPGDSKALRKERDEILSIRKEKHPDWDKLACAGSFFKNIVHADGSREAAGVFLDQVDCKNLSVGNATVFKKHANIIVNAGGATASDVAKLASLMRNRVKEKFGFELEPEVRLLGLSL